MGPDVVVNALTGLGYVFTASHLRVRQTLDLYRSASEKAGRPYPLFAAELPPS